MLITTKYLNQLEIASLSNIYAESINFSISELLCDFNDSVRNHGGKFHFWEENGILVSAVRSEFYQDGLILFNLQTPEAYRRRGYGTELVRSVLNFIDLSLPVYVHIEKSNAESFNLHRKIGFKTVFDYGKLIDGSISYRYITMVYKKDSSP